MNGLSPLKKERFLCVVIGTSAGGLSALTKLLPCVTPSLELPFLVTYHLKSENRDEHIPILSQRCPCPLLTAVDKADIRNGTVCFAPAGYHMLVERPRELSLSVDAKHRFARPSIDLLFESAARVFNSQLLGIVLTGANDDGSEGCRVIAEAGGMVIVQDPEEAAHSQMPLSALKSGGPRYVGTIAQIGESLAAIHEPDFPKLLRRINDAT